MTPREPTAPLLPGHWSPEQALAVFECLHALRANLWAVYGSQVKQAWRDQLLCDQEPPSFDPNEPF